MTVLTKQPIKLSVFFLDEISFSAKKASFQVFSKFASINNNLELQL